MATTMMVMMMLMRVDCAQVALYRNTVIECRIVFAGRRYVCVSMEITMQGSCVTQNDKK